MKKWICSVCGYVYDEEKEQTPFALLPANWRCPLCGADKAAFTPQQEQPAAPAVQKPVPEDMRLLTGGELAAVCSNLARGCEKQYKDKEAALFRELAGFFTAAAPEPAGDAGVLSGMLAQDLAEGYPALRAAAQADSDRGTLRICVWGEKVTAMLQSLMRRYEKEGGGFLAGTQIWMCTVCGFLYVGEQPPALCPVCKVPAWKFEKIEGRD